MGFSVGAASTVFSVGALTAPVSTLAGSRLVGRYSPRLLLLAGPGLMFASSVAALGLTLTGHLTRAWAPGLVGAGFLGLGQVFATAIGLALEETAARLRLRVAADSSLMSAR
ncbi:hypothetical protein [Nonomuraea sp. bgisy101]|uniref:hypothetical protein n=1 Tax=Nonomuraea sp. bgisy101 TaxID=3413784 RepID=UPI003D7553FC